MSSTHIRLARKAVQERDFQAFSDWDDAPLRIDVAHRDDDDWQAFVAFDALPMFPPRPWPHRDYSAAPRGPCSAEWMLPTVEPPPWTREVTLVRYDDRRHKPIVTVTTHERERASKEKAHKVYERYRPQPYVQTRAERIVTLVLQNYDRLHWREVMQERDERQTQYERERQAAVQLLIEKGWL